MNPTPVIPATPNATKTPPRWISWIWSVILALAMSPAAFAQNDELSITVSGRQQYGCPLMIKVTSKCNEIDAYANLKFDGKEVPTVGGTGEVVLDKVGSIWIEAKNSCKSTRRRINVTEMVMKTSLPFMDPEDDSENIRQIAIINLKLSDSPQGQLLEWEYTIIPWNLPGRGSSLVTGYSTTTYALGMGTDVGYPSEMRPTKSDRWISGRSWTGWARWANIEWSTVCGENYLTAQQPFIGRFF